MDINLQTKVGRFYFRVGAIIIREQQLLMVKNARDPYYYSVGGRVHYHETLEEAVVREVVEETGVTMEIQKLGFIHENFFKFEHSGEAIHEVSFFYYMQPIDPLRLINHSLTEDGIEEILEWLPIDQLHNYQLYPDFFKTDLFSGLAEVRHFVSRQD